MDGLCLSVVEETEGDTREGACSPTAAAAAANATAVAAAGPTNETFLRLPAEETALIEGDTRQALMKCSCAPDCMQWEELRCTCTSTAPLFQAASSAALIRADGAIAACLPHTRGAIFVTDALRAALLPHTEDAYDGSGSSSSKGPPFPYELSQELLFRLFSILALGTSFCFSHSKQGPKKALARSAATTTPCRKTKTGVLVVDSSAYELHWADKAGGPPGAPRPYLFKGSDPRCCCLLICDHLNR
ncbi:hypothetical protein Esti_000713 [Eimeria stiedai]